MQTQIINTVKQFILNNKKKGNNTLCVLSPYSYDAKEGYMQRVLAIDKYVFNNLCCIHLDFEGKENVLKSTLVDNRHLVINLIAHDKLSAKIALKIAKLCRVLYIHSVIRCKENIVGNAVEKLIKAKNIYKIWDVHGVLPEEHIMQLNFLEAQYATKAEELLINNADCTLVISDTMITHYENKYGAKLPNPINTSVFTSDSSNITHIIDNKPANEPFNVVYAGNTMAWQNIPLMKQTIEKCKDKYNFIIFTHDINDFNNQNSEAIMPNNLLIDSVPIEKVFETYSNCHFGFALRDDNPVNNVATPTKIIEYIQFGIIPIFKSEHIGDFVKLNLHYINYNELPTLNMSYEEYKSHVTHNYKILNKLKIIRENGIKKLKATIDKELLK